MKLGRNPNPKVMPPKRRLTNPPIYKITIVGSEGVGKTTFTKVYQSTYFEIKYIPTIDYSKTDVLFESPTTQCIFSIYDIGGQKDIPEINHIHYTDTNAIILMFDATDQISYDNLSFWYNDIMKVCSKDTPVVLVGNKYDIDNYKIKVIKRNIFGKHSIKYMKDIDFIKKTFKLEDTDNRDYTFKKDICVIKNLKKYNNLDELGTINTQ